MPEFDAVDKPESSDLEVVKLVQNRFTKSKRGRDEKVSEFPKLWDFAVKGKQWPKKRPSYRHSEVLNFTFSIIQSVIPIMTDVRPKVQALPREPEDTIFADLLSQVITDIWDRLYFDQQVVECIFDALVFGTSISMVGWDAEANHGVGDIIWKVVDPMMCYPDPLATDINSPDSGFFGYIEEVDLGELRRKHPDKADRLTTEQIERNKFKNIDVEDVDKIDPDREGETEQRNALLYRLWLKSDETEEYEEEVEGKVETRSKKKYPNGRYIEMCNNTILEDGENPFKDGLFPFARLVDHMVAREFWGIGEVDFLKSAQMSINKSISWILDSLDSTGKPIWIVDVQSGVDTDNLTNTPGLVVEKNAGSEVRREPGLPVPPSIFNVFNLLKVSFDQINGLGELSQGQAPSGVTSGAAIDSLQEAAQTRIRSKARNLESFLKQIGHLMVSRIMQFYKTPRMFRIVNDVSGVPEFFEFYIGDEGVKLQEIKPDDQGQMIPSGMQQIPMSTETKRKGFMDVKVSVGSALPFNKQMKTKQSFDLYDRQIIPAKEVLKNIDYPNWEAVAAEQEEKIAQQAEAAAAAEAQGGQ